MSVAMAEVARDVRVGGAAVSRVIGAGAGLDRAYAVRVLTPVGEPAGVYGAVGQGSAANHAIGMLSTNCPQGVVGRFRPPVVSGPAHSGRVPDQFAGRVERLPTHRMATGEPAVRSTR
jgi:hypothetical protein